MEIQQGHDFFVNYDNKQIEAHLWLNPFQKITNNTAMLWNLEIYPKGQNLQILKLQKEPNGHYTEIFRDPKLKTNINTVIEIIESFSYTE